MFTSKTKNYSVISLNEVKEDLRIDVSDSQYNQEITRTIKAAVNVAEQFTGIDIVPTVCTLEDYLFSGCYITINQPSISITSIQADGNAITGYTLYKNHQNTIIKLPRTVQADKINVVYNAGYSTIPADIMKAISIKIGELFDGDRNGYVNGSMKETRAFERLLYPHKILIY